MTSRLHHTGFTAGDAAKIPAAVLMDLIFSHRPLPDDTIPAVRSLLAARIRNRSFVSFAEAWNTVTGRDSPLIVGRPQVSIGPKRLCGVGMPEPVGDLRGREATPASPLSRAELDTVDVRACFNRPVSRIEIRRLVATVHALAARTGGVL